MESERARKRAKYQPTTVTNREPGPWPVPWREKLRALASGLGAPPTGARSSFDHDSVCLLTTEGKFKKVSTGFCQMLGYGPGDLLDKPIDEVTASRTVNIPQHLGAVFHFGQFQSLWVFVHRDGGPILTQNAWELFPDYSIAVACRCLFAGE